MAWIPSEEIGDLAQTGEDPLWALSLVGVGLDLFLEKQVR